MTADAWQQAEPVSHAGGVTLFSGSTFLLGDAAGEVRHEPHGFFVADRRAVSRLQIVVDDHQLVVLSIDVDDEDSARVVRRVVPATGVDGEASLLLTTRTVVRDHELRTTVLLRNAATSPRSLTLRLLVASDLADVFAVKEGRVGGLAAVPVEPTPTGVRMTAQGVVVDVECHEGTFTLADGVLVEELVVAAHSTVERSLEVHVHSVAGHGQVRHGTAPVHHPQVATRSTELAGALAQGVDDLSALRIPDPLTGGDALAAGAPWFMTLFGRDSLLSALMLAPYDQSLGLQVLRSLAARQGTKVDTLSEEEPGRIVHETRMATGSSLFEGHRSLYYGSTDATPLFVVLLAELVRHGLDPDAARDLLPAADSCLAWVDAYGDVDGDGLVESVRRNPAGLINQGWKDSWNAIVDERGDVVEPPLALVEVQGYVHAAHVARAYLADVLEGRSGRVHLARAERLRRLVDERYWLPELGTYALALGPDKRPLRSSTSNAGHLLWTGTALPERVPKLAATLVDRRMRTHWGLRTLASDHPAYDPLGYHTGSVWPHDTALVAWGLARWGLARAARELATGLIRTASAFGGTLPELVSGLEAGDPVAGFRPVRFPTACSPQAWAAAAPVLVLRTVLGLEPDLPRGRVLVNPHVPDGWHPLTLHRMHWGSLRVLLKATEDDVVLGGLPDGVVVEHRPLHA